jgi:hypothetical protein
MKRCELIAYLAGAIDSDGTIGVKKSTYAMRVRKDSTQPSYSERLCLRQVQKNIPQLLKDNFGGSLYLMKSSAEKGKPLFSWSITDKKAYDCIQALLPYLLVKRAQALNLIELRKIKNISKKYRIRRKRGHVGSARRTAAHSEAMERCYQKAKQLNAVGI